MESQTINVYCDESCHLEHDGIPVMAWGGLSCSLSETNAVSVAARDLKLRHGLAKDFEAKWSKVSPAKVDYYLALADMFIADHRLKFRAVLVSGKRALNDGMPGQSLDDRYCKMHCTLLKTIVRHPLRYRVYLDVKDTRGGDKLQKLRDVLARTSHDFDLESIERIQQVRSRESELMQITDLLIGAITYKNRGLCRSSAKSAIVKQLSNRLGDYTLSTTSAFSADKFNLLHWKPRKISS